MNQDENESGKGEKTIEFGECVGAEVKGKASTVEGKCVFKASVKRSICVDTCPVKLNHIASTPAICLTQNVSRGKDVPSVLKRLKLYYTAV